MKRLIRSAIMVIGLGMGGWWAYTVFLAPPASLVNRSQATDSAQAAMLNEDWDEALAAIEQGLTSAPNDWELLVWRSVLRIRTGTADAGDFDRALTIGPIGEVWTVRGMVALLVRDAELTIEAGQQLIGQAPDTPQGYFLIAQAYELQGRDQEALAQYREAEQRSAENAEYSGIYVAARERIFAITTLPQD